MRPPTNNFAKQNRRRIEGLLAKLLLLLVRPPSLKGKPAPNHRLRLLLRRNGLNHTYAGPEPLLQGLPNFTPFGLGPLRRTGAGHKQDQWQLKSLLERLIGARGRPTATSGLDRVHKRSFIGRPGAHLDGQVWDLGRLHNTGPGVRNLLALWCLHATVPRLLATVLLDVETANHGLHLSQVTIAGLQSTEKCIAMLRVSAETVSQSHTAAGQGADLAPVGHDLLKPTKMLRIDSLQSQHAQSDKLRVVGPMEIREPPNHGTPRTAAHELAPQLLLHRVLLHLRDGKTRGITRQQVVTTEVRSHLHQPTSDGIPGRVGQTLARTAGTVLVANLLIGMESQDRSLLVNGTEHHLLDGNRLKILHGLQSRGVQRKLRPAKPRPQEMQVPGRRRLATRPNIIEHAQKFLQLLKGRRGRKLADRLRLRRVLQTTTTTYVLP